MLDIDSVSSRHGTRDNLGTWELAGVSVLRELKEISVLSDIHTMAFGHAVSWMLFRLELVDVPMVVLAVAIVSTFAVSERLR